MNTYKIYFYLLESKTEFPFNLVITYAKNKELKESTLLSGIEELSDNKVELNALLSPIYSLFTTSKLMSKFQGEALSDTIGLTVEDANLFVTELPVFEKAQITCRLPKWYHKSEKQVKVETCFKQKSENSMNVLGFGVDAYIDGVKVSYEELQKIASQLEPLALVKNKWIKVNKNQIKKTVDAINKLNKLNDKLEKDANAIIEVKKEAEEIAKTDDIVEFTCSNKDWLSILSTKLNQPVRPDTIKTSDLTAVLRDYQQRGVNWLNYMHKMKLGACLADDMGLGKTIQVIALLNHVRHCSRGKEKTLLVVPVSLLKNWEQEFAKFAPNMKVYFLHPSVESDLFYSEIDKPEQYDVFVTTYSYIGRLPWLLQKEWDNVIIDEAQAIKNPSTQQTLSVKKLKSKFRVAITGTPFENSLLDVWSIFDFLNAGILGNEDEFKDYYRRNKKDDEVLSNIRKIIEFFILRRMKVDKTIVPDLPKKLEHDVLVDMTVQQVALYQGLVNRIQAMDFPNVLPFLTKFKQICNHPSQYLGREEFEVKDSNKFVALKMLATDIKKRKEKVIIFTQFAELIPALYELLSEVFGTAGLTLDGSTPAAQRGKLVAKFQTSVDYPFFICSLKAGGVGLNLTAANNVIHFDRWWNPAIENQATDRAYRIGQKKNVNVYKFITTGSLEESIDNLLKEKTETFNTIIPSKQEEWLSQTICRDLMKRFKITL